MPRVHSSTKKKVEKMVKLTVLTSELSSKHAEDARRYADIAKKTLAKIYVVLRESYPTDSCSSESDSPLTRK